MREEDVDPRQALGDADAEAADAGARVDDQRGAIGELELDARGVAAVAVHLRPRCRNRASGPPHLHSHRTLTFSSLLPGAYRGSAAATGVPNRPDEDHRSLLAAFGDD